MSQILNRPAGYQILPPWVLDGLRDAEDDLIRFFDSVEAVVAPLRGLDWRFTSWWRSPKAQRGLFGRGGVRASAHLVGLAADINGGRPGQTIVPPLEAMFEARARAAGLETINAQWYRVRGFAPHLHLELEPRSMQAQARMAQLSMIS